MIQYHKDLPSYCPPAEVEAVACELYKAIDGTKPVEKDFHSFAERKRCGIDPSLCEAWGLSVWPTIDAVNHALNAYPHFRRKRIIKFAVTAADGRLMATPSKAQPDHHTFWKDASCNLLNSCEIVISPEGK